VRATSDRKRVSEDVADVHSDTLIPRCHSSTPLPVPAKPHQGVAPSIGRLRVLLSRAQLEIWAFVTPDVTPSAFQCAFSSLNISDKPLIFKRGAGEGNRTLVISLEEFCSIRIRPAASAGRSLACRRPAHQERATRAPFCISDPICRLFHVSVNAATPYNSH